MIRKRKTPAGLLAAVLVFLLVLGYYAAGVFTYPKASLFTFQELFGQVLSHPFKNYTNAMTAPFLAAAALVWILFTAWYLDHHRNTHQGIEHGSSEWADIRKVREELTDKEPRDTRILSRNIEIPLDGEKSLSNNNGICMGAPGTGKTMYVIASNILKKKKSSYVFTDPKGEILAKFGNYLEKVLGYRIRALDLREMARSHCYNPFAYIREEDDIPRLVTNIFRSVDPPDAVKNDPFWDQGCALYLQAIFYFVALVPRDAKDAVLQRAQAGETVRLAGNPEYRDATMNQVTALSQMEMETARTDKNGRPLKGDGPPYSILNKIVDILAETDERHEMSPCVRDYRKLKGGAQETVRSIILILNAKLTYFNSPGVRRIFSRDEMHLEELGAGADWDQESPTALFLITKENDTTYNFLPNMLYQQMFDRLIDVADQEFRGPLPLRVEVFMDEFYNGVRPDRFENLITTLRSRNISVMLFIQSVNQLDAMFKEKVSKIIFDACSHFIFMGCGRTAYDTQKWFSDLLDDASIEKSSDTLRGHQDGSVSYDGLQRRLMTPSEVGRMKKDCCILFLEGQQPVFDRKYKPFKSREFRQAMDLGPYERPMRDQKTGYGKILSLGGERPFRILSGQAKDHYLGEAAGRGTQVLTMTEEEFLALDIPDFDVESGTPEDREWAAARMSYRLKKEAEEYRKEREDAAARRIREGAPRKAAALPPEEDAAAPVPGTEAAPEGMTARRPRPEGDIYEWIYAHVDQFDNAQARELLLGLGQGLDPMELEMMASEESAERMRLLRMLFSGKDRNEVV